MYSIPFSCMCGEISKIDLKTLIFPIVTSTEQMLQLFCGQKSMSIYYCYIHQKIGNNRVKQSQKLKCSPQVLRRTHSKKSFNYSNIRWNLSSSQDLSFLRVHTLIEGVIKNFSARFSPP